MLKYHKVNVFNSTFLYFKTLKRFLFDEVKDKFNIRMYCQFFSF